MDKQERATSNEDRLRHLLVCGLAGDAQAYRTFLHDLSAHLRSFFRRRMSGLPDEVEDLVQESLIAVHNQRHTYDPEQPLTAWVHALAKYKLVDVFRRRGVRDAHNVSLDDVPDILGHDDVDAAAAKLDVDKLLLLLPDRQRLPILFMKIEGLSVTETARLTGMSESAVKVGVHRGLKALAALIRVTR